MCFPISVADQGIFQLDHLMTLHVHKERTDNLLLSDVADEFVSKSERRLQVFGKF